MDESKTFTTFPSEIEGFQESQNIVLTETKYVPLHVHTTHSVTDSLVLPEELAKKCKEKGFGAVAITDHGSVTGWYQFQEACKKYEVQPVLGVEFYVSKTFGDKDKEREHLVVLAKNEIGMRNIFKLQEISDRKGYYYKPRIRLEDLYEYHDGLIVLTACTQGVIAQPFLKGQPGMAVLRLERLKEVFGEDLYLELQPHYEYDDQKKSNKELIRLSEEFNIPLVITTDLHYIEKEDKKYHDLLKAVVFRQPLGEAGFSITTNYLMDSEDLIRKGKDTAIPEEITIEAMKNTIKVAEKCSAKLTPYKNALPRIKK
jgi:DNA polymerase-3 subunit alpha